MASMETQQLSNLPLVVIFHEILPRLPAKSLVRFKCVSKLWLKTISEPDFAKSHLRFQTPGRINIRQGSMLHFTDSTDADLYKINLFDILNETRLQPIKSCNGLLLVRGKHKDNGKVGNYIINPVTGRYLKLPSTQAFTDCFMHFDGVSNQYKILGWDANRYLNPDPVYLLIINDCDDTSKISWRTFKAPRDLIMMWYTPAVFNGWCHWIVNHRLNRVWAILALNLESGEFRVMEMPDTRLFVPPNGWNYRLAMANESLYLIQHHCPGNNYCYILWRLEDHCQEIWTETCQYRVEYCERCKESGWDNGSSASTTLLNVKEIVKKGPQYYNDIAHTNTLIWLDTIL